VYVCVLVYNFSNNLITRYIVTSNNHNVITTQKHCILHLAFIRCRRSLELAERLLSDSVWYDAKLSLIKGHKETTDMYDDNDDNNDDQSV